MNKGKLILSMILVMTAAAATTSANAQSVKGKNDQHSNTHVTLQRI